MVRQASKKPIKKTAKKVQRPANLNKDKSKPEKPISRPVPVEPIPQVENDDLVVKKNTGGKKGKKKWASKIDTTVFEKKIEEQHDQKRKEMQEQNQKALGFEIDVEPQGKKDLKPLEKDRFKKKDFEKVISIKQLRLIEKKAKNIDVAVQQKEQEPDLLKQTNLDSRNYTEATVWDENQEKISEDPLVQPPKIQKNKVEIDIKRVVLPPSGLSYNPSTSAYNKLVQESIEDQMKRDQEIIVHTRSKKFERELENAKNKNLKRKRAKSQKVRLEQDLAEARKKEKQFNHQFLNIKNIKKELDAQEKSIEEARKIQKQREEEEEYNRKVLGVVGTKKGKKLGNKKYEYKKDIFLEEDIPDNLKNINNNQDIIRDQFDSIFRRGLLETRKQENRTKNRVPARKNYGKYRSLKEGEDDWMNEQKDTLPSDMNKNNNPIAIINK
ncbi:hypothetical protein PPERSA_10227 [Pseudocohnilembus persalinus]|uniref:Ribosome biogenesis protein NOP53 n=1 Tax=Pseudocohnilembus persalinus TaxID=266149 RepID=A0A0V0QLT9_PSEPJ|nr:hypothetical protein PPERSA_10227 [Pseudocohnilembus persalinus]|eukprot:KRX03146.1 hypothetical protein PPERSA_10227 [Pseudocohnilembus persalinus]